MSTRVTTCALIALLAAGAFGGAAGAAEEPSVQLPARLTLADALRLFRERGLDMLLADAAVQSAEGDLKAAGALPNPTWQGGVTRSYFDQHLFSSEWGWFAGVGDGNALEDVLTGKHYLRLKVARRALAAARLSRKDAARTLEFQLKLAYIEAVKARDALDFALEVQKTSLVTLSLNQVRYKAGAISEADVAKVETAKLEADQAVTAASQALRVAKIGVAFMLGVRGVIPEFQIEQDLPRFYVPPELAGATLASLLDRALLDRPDLRAASFQRDRAQVALALSKRLRFPDFSLNLQYTWQGSGTPEMTAMGLIGPSSPPTLQISLAGTIPLLYQQQGEIEKARADLRAQRLLVDKQAAQVAADVDVAYTNFLATRDLVERMEGRLLDRARRARNLVAIQYQKGAASLLEYLDAQRTYIQANVEFIEDLGNYWIAVFQLEQAVGGNLR